MSVKLEIEDGVILSVDTDAAEPMDATDVEVPYEPQGKVDVWIAYDGTLKHKPYKG